MSAAYFWTQPASGCGLSQLVFGWGANAGAAAEDAEPPESATNVGADGGAELPESATSVAAFGGKAQKVGSFPPHQAQLGCAGEGSPFGSPNVARLGSPLPGGGIKAGILGGRAGGRSSSGVTLGTSLFSGP